MILLTLRCDPGNRHRDKTLPSHDWPLPTLPSHCLGKMTTHGIGQQSWSITLFYGCLLRGREKKSVFAYKVSTFGLTESQ